MSAFTVNKLNHRGEQELSYTGEAIEHGENFVCIRAPFTFSTRDLGYVVLKTGDIFTEWFYTDRWYNVFQINDVDSGSLKGYYCNLTRPAHIIEASLSAEDLALDIFVKPDGEILRLDEEDYAALPLADDERKQVEVAIATIEDLVKRRVAPFAALADSE